MKKFYKAASTRKTDEGYAILLDDKSARTPAGSLLLAPGKATASAVVAEWVAQKTHIDPDTMPLTQILIAAHDRMRERDAITKKLSAYVDTDMICYRAAEPEDIARKQQEAWDPWIEWFSEDFGVKLKTTTKLETLKQDDEAKKRIWNYGEALDEYYFAVLQILTSLTGSIVLSLAFMEGQLIPQQLFDLVQLEEIHHAQIAGEDIHGSDPLQEKQQKAMLRDFEAAKKFLDLLNEDA